MTKFSNDYLLYVGTLQPRKNLVRAIEAFGLLKRDSTLKFVIAGKKGWLYDEIFEKVKELNLENEVIFTGYVPDEDLPELYKNAKAFIFVSLYEGFGLPVLEAMSYGIPVLTSNTSSLPEVAGDAALLVDPENTEEIAKGMERLLTDEKLRQQLISKGKEQIKKFSWEKAAKETLQVLEEVAGLK